jgi:hypothetical protein
MDSSCVAAEISPSYRQMDKVGDVLGGESFAFATWRKDRHGIDCWPHAADTIELLVRFQLP